MTSYNYKQKSFRQYFQIAAMVFYLLSGLGLSQSLLAQTVTTIGTQVVTTTTSGISPYNYFWESRRVQFVYTAAEMTGAGMAAGNISAIAFDVSAVNGNNLVNYTIKMRHTANTDAAAHDGGAFTTVKNAHTLVPGSTGWRTITFDTPFAWDGTSNVCVDVCWGINAGWSSSGQIWLYNNVANQMRGVNSSTANQCANTTGTTANGKPRVQFTWAASSACSGTPNAGTATITSSTGCPSVNFTLGATGITTGSGISYQWESAPSGSGPWNPISGATSSSYTTNTATTTFYRLITTCSNGGGTNTSSSVSYTPSGGACACGTYAASAATTTFDGEITNVTIGTMNNTSNCFTAAPGPGSILNRYANYTTSVSGHSAEQGQLVSFSYTVGSCGGSYPHHAKIFADWNQDGDFLDAGEEVYASATTTSPTNTISGSFNVPLTATAGSTRLRIIMSEEYGGNFITPNYSYSYGETEDYCFTVTVAPPCSGTPNPGATTSTLTVACVSQNFTLGFNGSLSGTGITYQWQSGPSATGPWTDISGATNPTRVQTQDRKSVV